MEFVWSDELALLLIEEDGEDRREVAGWVLRPVGYRLPHDTTPLMFGRSLLERQRAGGVAERRAS